MLVALKLTDFMIILIDSQLSSSGYIDNCYLFLHGSKVYIAVENRINCCRLALPFDLS